MRDFNPQKWRQAVVGLLFCLYVCCVAFAEMSCNPPPTLEHGTVLELLETRPTSFPLGFEITYVCDEGYRILSGQRRSRCGRRGWSGKTPSCEVVGCPDPGVPENGETQGTDYRVGSKVNFSCHPGYELLGSSELECLPRGQWSDEPARCNAPSNYCPNPGAPIGGSKNTSEYGRLLSVGFRCRTGYILVGSDVRQCLRNRTWSGIETRCIGPGEFDSEFQVADMMRVKELREKERSRYMSSSDSPRLLDSSFPGRTILYFAFDVSRSLTRHDFKVGIAFAKEIVKQVGISVDGPRAGALTFSSGVETQFSPVTYNSTEDVLTAFDRIEFSGGGGTDVNSVLQKIREDSMARVKYVLGEKRTKSVIFLLTDGKVNGGGDPGREAGLLKAQGAKIFCIGVKADVRKRTLHRVASTSRFGQETRSNVFVLSEYKHLEWVAQIIAEAHSATFGAVFSLHAHFEWTVSNVDFRRQRTVSNVTCFSEENNQQIHFSRLLDTGTGGALPRGAQTYSLGRTAVLDLSGVLDDDKRGVYVCRQENRTGITFMIHTFGYFIQPQVASIGDRVTLTSGAFHGFDVPYRWMHDGERVPAKDGQYRWQIDRVTREDSGIYELYLEGDRRRTQWFFNLVVRGCPAHFFGERCDRTCPTCYNGGRCHVKFGTCVCASGFKGQRCEVACGRNRVGPDCSESCAGGNCYLQRFCKPDPYGCSCASGYRGFHCDADCGEEVFGVDCIQNCNCKDDFCDPYTGACSGGCPPGWTGLSCQIPVGT